MSKLWGSRFESDKTNALADQFTFSISYDHKLAKYDVIGSIAHAEMLGACDIVAAKDVKAIVAGLKAILKDIDSGTFKYSAKAEDIHTDIQQKLEKLVGEPAKKLHTARSRNDQVAVDVRMYCLDQINTIIGQIAGLQTAMIGFADAHQDVIIPAYTHLQSAQLVTMAHHILAYVEMLERDKARFLDAAKRVNVNPLGSGALSGTTLPINRDITTQLLGFKMPSANSMDAVSDRDFIVEILGAIAITGMHLSRVCEDFIIWSSQEFNFLDVDWAFCTGSSIMPHKKNPDVLELIRGASAKFPGRLMELLTLMKALPLTYNRDMQLDKPALFESVETLQNMLPLMEQLFLSLKVKKDVIAERVKDECFFSVDLMDYLMKKGVSNREAHDAVGKMVKGCLDKGTKLSSLSAKEWQAFHPKFEQDVKDLLTAKASVAGRQSFGSPNPKFVAKQIKAWKTKLAE